MIVIVAVSDLEVLIAVMLWSLADLVYCDAIFIVMMYSYSEGSSTEGMALFMAVCECNSWIGK